MRSMCPCRRSNRLQPRIAARNKAGQCKVFDADIYSVASTLTLPVPARLPPAYRDMCTARHLLGSYQRKQ